MLNVTLTVIDTINDDAMRTARETYPDSIPAYGVGSMVDAILNRIALTHSTRNSDPVLIGLLRVLGHGAPGRQHIGNSDVSENPLQMISLDDHGHLRNRPALSRLRGSFGAGAVVELHGCRVGGRGFDALRRNLENLWGVSVRASRIVQYSSTPELDYFTPLVPTGAIRDRR